MAAFSEELSIPGRVERGPWGAGEGERESGKGRVREGDGERETGRENIESALYILSLY